jgi:hypothetical protein
MPASTTSLKLDTATKERVRRLASARRRSPHWLMREAIQEYVEREEKREQFRQGRASRLGALPGHRPAHHRRGSRRLAGQARSG